MAFNQVTLIGTAINEKMSYTGKGLAFLQFDVGVRKSVENDDGQTRTQVSYTRTIIFGRRAEMLLEHIENHDVTVVSVSGRLDQNRTDDGKSYNKVVADEILMLDGDFKTWQDSKNNHLLVGGMNCLTLSGNLVEDVEAKELNSDGLNVLNGRIASNSKYKGKESVVYVRFAAWNGKAKKLDGACKGQAVLIKGALLSNSYQNNDGDTVYYDEIAVTNVSLVKKFNVSTKAKAVEDKEEDCF